MLNSTHILPYIFIPQATVGNIFPKCLLLIIIRYSVRKRSRIQLPIWAPYLNIQNHSVFIGEFLNLLFRHTFLYSKISALQPQLWATFGQLFKSALEKWGVPALLVLKNLTYMEEN